MMYNGQQIPSELAEAVPDSSRDIIRRGCRECDMDIWSVYDENYNHQLYRPDGTKDDSSFLNGMRSNIQVIEHRRDDRENFICEDCRKDVSDTAHTRWITQRRGAPMRWKQSGDYIMSESDGDLNTYQISEFDKMICGLQDVYHDYIMIDTPRVAYQQAGTSLYPDLHSFITPDKILLHEQNALDFRSKYNIDLPAGWVMPNTLSSF